MRRGFGIFLALVATASVAHAHGGMAGPDELGPPLFTSAVLAFVCYWVVILWPTSKRMTSDDPPDGKKSLAAEKRRVARRAYKNATSRQTSQLRRVESIRAQGAADSRRKASDA